MVKVRGLSGMWDVVFHPTVEDAVMNDSGTETCTVFIAKTAGGKGYVAYDPRARSSQRIRSTVDNESERKRRAADSRW